MHKTLQGQVQAAGFPTLYNSFTPAGQAFDKMTLYDWINTYVPGGHGSQLGTLLNAAYNEEYGAETTGQSALNLIYLLGYKSGPGTWSIYGASDERYHIAGGNAKLPTRDRERAPSGNIHYGYCDDVDRAQQRRVDQRLVRQRHDDQGRPCDPVDELLGAAHAQLQEGRIRFVEADGDHPARLRPATSS